MFNKLRGSLWGSLILLRACWLIIFKKRFSRNIFKRLEMNDVLKWIYKYFKMFITVLKISLEEKINKKISTEISITR